MEVRIRTRPEEWACTKFCRIALDGPSVWQYILWLCDHTREQLAEFLESHKRGGPIWHDPIESTWGWNAPRQRCAKLLWQLLHDATDEDFYRHFTFAVPDIGANTVELLTPIQKRLRMVIDGLVARREQDDQLGQADWGEHWWLPDEQATIVRQQLKGTRAELIEQSSEYEDAVSHGLCYYIRHTVKGIAVPCDDPNRIYVGRRLRRRGRRVFIWVKDTKGNEYPLRHGDCPYMEADGTGFEWGYSGHGPGALNRCVLIDALDGDLMLGEELDRLTPGLFEKHILRHPREKNFKITRRQVHQWLREVGKFEYYEQRRKSIADSIVAHARYVAEREALIGRIQRAGGLRVQRFDVVPESFESALYLDLMRMLELGGAALRCSHCNLPIPDDHSSRANKQRARAKTGKPIYHAECFAEFTRLRKKAYWKRRAKSVPFRESERARAREYRKLS
jgi:hypothetical protein